MVPSTIYPFYGRQYSQNVEKGEGEILKNIFTFNFNNQCHTGYGSHEFTSINVCTINNKCRFSSGRGLEVSDEVSDGLALSKFKLKY